MSHMKRWVLAALTAGVSTPGAVADSIWDRRDPRYAYLFQDNRARQVGDIITITVSENTVANESDQRAQDKGTNTTGTIDYAGSSSANGGAGQTGALSFSLANAFRRRFAGNATLTSNRVFTDRMAVTVVDLLPNGNLVVEGYRSRVVAGEERVLRITGVVRQQDVAIGNTVPSAVVSNFRISYLGRGPTSRAVNQNYLGRATNLLWPW